MKAERSGKFRRCEFKHPEKLTIYTKGGPESVEDDDVSSGNPREISTNRMV